MPSLHQTVAADRFPQLLLDKFHETGHTAHLETYFEKVTGEGWTRRALRVHYLHFVAEHGWSASTYAHVTLRLILRREKLNRTTIATEWQAIFSPSVRRS